ncbi:hypothetical protein FS749_009592 [Ceratobasidium sp. UAMH 11750]|nr:hypothetical protein FS749_009592 [Ceratobasidium sp. UAMH 11750]
MAYRDQTNELAQYRYLLQAHDSGTIYARYFKLQGIDVNRKPHFNIHDWLTRDSPHFKPTLAEAIFHYSPRTNKQDRLEVCIATPEMIEAAWQYGHGKQILMDGTFGVCDSRILLFILMGIDSGHHGVPLAFLLFSAPGDNQAEQSGYDAAILVKLLSAWKKMLSDKFKPAVATTDSDLKERNALLKVFPEIFLTMCRFHFRQALRNNRRRRLGSKVEGRDMMRDRLITFEVQLIRSTDWESARSMTFLELDNLRILAQNTRYAAIAERGISHVQYIINTWLREDIWASWSDYGRVLAAAKTGLTILDIASTTNHLESFNGLLKQHHLLKASHNRRLLRFDVLVTLFVNEIVPSIFQQRRLRARENQLLHKTFAALPGGKEVLEHRNARPTPQKPVAYLVADVQRDTEAQILFKGNYVSNPCIQDLGIELTCYSSRPMLPGQPPIWYSMWFGYDRRGSCSCPDFQQRGGACKHMRAALLKITALQQWLLSTNSWDPLVTVPEQLLPQNEESARHIEQAAQSVLTSRQPLAQLEHETILQASNFVATMLADGHGHDSEVIEESTAPHIIMEESSDEDSDGETFVSNNNFLCCNDKTHKQKPQLHEGIQPSSRAAITQQVIGRAVNEMERSKRVLSHVSELMVQLNVNDPIESADRTTLEQYATYLETISAQIRGVTRLHRQAAPPEHENVPARCTSAPATAEGAGPIAVSPKRKRQKRFQSNANY